MMERKDREIGRAELLQHSRYHLIALLGFAHTVTQNTLRKICSVPHAALFCFSIKMSMRCSICAGKMLNGMPAKHVRTIETIWVWIMWKMESNIRWHMKIKVFYLHTVDDDVLHTQRNDTTNWEIKRERESERMAGWNELRVVHLTYQ